MLEVRMTADEVLADLVWVRRLAAQLARDDGDDVAQETWLLAVEKEPARDRPLRAWLAGVARRVAHGRRRAAARRLQREARALDTTTAPPADTLLLKAELLRLVAELVGQLDEPFRSTVLLRFYEGMTSSAIAARDGVPPATVRWRLARAIERLRAGLDQRVAGGRGRWMLVLAPPAGVAFKLVAVAAGVVVVLGGGAQVVHMRAGAPAIAGASTAKAAIPLAHAPRSDVSNLSERAQDAYVQGQYGDAIELGRELVEEDPEKGWRIVGASSCFVHDSDGAAEAWNKLDGRGKMFIQYVCGRNDTVLAGVTPVL
jgi:RNA polymerase sigma-70 factor (ECF subfamily)